MRDERLESSLIEIDDLKAALNWHVIVAITNPQPKPPSSMTSFLKLSWAHFSAQVIH
jgi:hypothetical protein